MAFILINLFFVVIIVIALIVLWFVWPPDSPWSPWWRTNRQKAVAAGSLAKIGSKDIVYELGSGDANFLVAVAKKFGAAGVGIEIDPVRNLTARLNVFKNGVSNKIVLNRGNFYDFDLSPATVVFVYLVPRVLGKLKPKLIRELKKGTRVISYRYEFEISEKNKLRFVRSDRKNQVYLYKII